MEFAWIEIAIVKDRDPFEEKQIFFNSNSLFSFLLHVTPSQNDCCDQDMMHFDRGVDAGNRFLEKLDDYKKYDKGTPIMLSLAFVAARDGDEEHIIAESDFIIDHFRSTV